MCLIPTSPLVSYGWAGGGKRGSGYLFVKGHVSVGHGHEDHEIPSIMLHGGEELVIRRLGNGTIQVFTREWI